MKAWQLESETMKKGIPVVLEEDEQGWDLCSEIGKSQNEYVRMRWHSHVPGSNALEHSIIGAIQDYEHMGYDVSKAEECIEEGLKALEENDNATLCKLSARLFRLLNEAPKISNHRYWTFKQYEDFEDYAANASLPIKEFKENDEELTRLNLIGWQAQIAGGALGTALEGYTTENIEKVFGNITGYVRKPNTYNDDITYEIAFLKALKEHGRSVTATDIAEQWVALIPTGWSAEEIALQNLRLGVFPPKSGKHNNPYREWIGAQMRGAVCGMVAPGNTFEAARLAFLDGQVSHHNNGILGEIFNAVMTAAAYVENDVRRVLRIGIEAIPSDSEYYDVVNFAHTQCEECKDWRSAQKKCLERYGEYNWIHAYPNACSEVISMYFGNGDFDRTMNISAMFGWDVDCNAAQVATIVAICNKTAIDIKWTAPIGDILYTYMRDIPQIKISNLAEETTKLKTC